MYNQPSELAKLGSLGIPVEGLLAETIPETLNTDKELSHEHGNNYLSGDRTKAAL